VVTVVNIPDQAVAMGGQWDFQWGHAGNGGKVIEQGNASYDTQVTFGCTRGAIGKCASVLGYKPWEASNRECKVVCDGDPGSQRCGLQCTQPTKELLHEACVRMVRADYCGDGVSHTLDGVTIDIWDYAGLQQATAVSTNAASGWGHDAEWTPNGARCVANALLSRTDLDPANTKTFYDPGPIDNYLEQHCAGKWNAIDPNFSWKSGNCFGAKSTFGYGNVPSGFDWHDRVLLRDTSICIADSGRPNPDAANTAICVTDPRLIYYQ
jgi:hypothetical protein